MKVTNIKLRNFTKAEINQLELDDEKKKTAFELHEKYQNTLDPQKQDEYESAFQDLFRKEKPTEKSKLYPLQAYESIMDEELLQSCRDCAIVAADMSKDSSEALHKFLTWALPVLESNGYKLPPISETRSFLAIQASKRPIQTIEYSPDINLFEKTFEYLNRSFFHLTARDKTVLKVFLTQMKTTAVHGSEISKRDYIIRPFILDLFSCGSSDSRFSPNGRNVGKSTFAEALGDCLQSFARLSSSGLDDFLDRFVNPELFRTTFILGDDVCISTQREIRPLCNIATKTGTTVLEQKGVNERISCPNIADILISTNERLPAARLEPDKFREITFRGTRDFNKFMIKHEDSFYKLVTSMFNACPIQRDYVDYLLSDEVSNVFDSSEDYKFGTNESFARVLYDIQAKRNFFGIEDVWEYLRKQTSLRRCTLNTLGFSNKLIDAAEAAGILETRIYKGNNILYFLNNNCKADIMNIDGEKLQKLVQEVEEIPFTEWDENFIQGLLEGEENDERLQEGLQEEYPKEFPEELQEGLQEGLQEEYPKEFRNSELQIADTNDGAIEKERRELEAGVQLCNAKNNEATKHSEDLRIEACNLATTTTEITDRIGECNSEKRDVTENPARVFPVPCQGSETTTTAESETATATATAQAQIQSCSEKEDIRASIEKFFAELDYEY